MARRQGGDVRIAPAALAVLLLLGGCDRLGIGVTPIGDIKNNPAAFQGEDVTLRGKVTRSNKIPLLNVTLYEIQDDTARIWVTTTLDQPPAGETVTVRGKVENAAILGGKGFGVTVAERSRRE